MAKRVKKPVKINEIEFDALISSENTFEATVPEYAVEDGYSVSDNIILGAETLKLVLFLTDTPVTWRRRSGHGKGHVETVIQKLQDLYYDRELCTVRTLEKTYTNMAIESLTISKSLEVGYAREIPISFRKIRITETSTTIIPEEYGKSGATQEPAGTASTSAGSTGSGSTGGGSGGRKSGSGGSKKNDNVNEALKDTAEIFYLEEKKKSPEIFGKSTVHTGVGGLTYGGKTGGSFDVSTGAIARNNVSNYSSVKRQKNIINGKATDKKSSSEKVLPNLLGSE